MRVVLHLQGATLEWAGWYAAALQVMTGFHATVLPDEERPRSGSSASLSRTRADTSSPKVDDSSRFVVATMLGTRVATVGDLEAAMMMVLVERGPLGFPDVHELWVVLQQYPCWRGKRHMVVPTYKGMRSQLAPTQHRLRGKGYGFESGGATVLRVAPAEDARV